MVLMKLKRFLQYIFEQTTGVQGGKVQGSSGVSRWGEGGQKLGVQKVVSCLILNAFNIREEVKTHKEKTT